MILFIEHFCFPLCQYEDAIAVHDPFVEKYLPRHLQSASLATRTSSRQTWTKKKTSPSRHRHRRFDLLKRPHRSRYKCVAPHLARTRTRRRLEPSRQSLSAVKDAEGGRERFSRAKRREWLASNDPDEERYKRVCFGFPCYSRAGSALIVVLCMCVCVWLSTAHTRIIGGHTQRVFPTLHWTDRSSVFQRGAEDDHYTRTAVLQVRVQIGLHMSLFLGVRGYE